MDGSEGGVVVLLLVVGLALLAGIGYLSAAAVAGDKVPLGTSVGGVQIGGRSPEDATRVLRAEMSERLGQPFTVTVGGVSQPITPAQAGISVDYAATVDRAGGGRTLDPERLWDYYDGGRDLEPVVRVEQSRMTEVLDELSAATGTRPRDGAISFASGRPVIVEPRLGAVVDTDSAASLIVEAWAAGADQVALPLRVSEPRIDAADLRAAVEEFANPAVSGPVTLVFKNSRATLSPRDFAPLLGTRVRDGRLVPDVRSAELAGLVGLVGRDDEPVDASITLADGAPRVVRARSGATYGPDDVTEAFLEGVVASGDARTVQVEGTRVPPALSTKAVRELRVTEQVAASTVPVSAVDGDLQSSVGQLDGTLVLPGETFSLNATAGEVGASAPQLATAAYVAAYNAGLEVVQRTAPTQRVRGAPLGREATVSWGSVDLQWRNDTSHGVLVAAGVDPNGAVSVSLWSTRVREVTTSLSARRNLTVPATVTLATPDCVPSSGAEGFEVEVTREVRDLETQEVVRSDTAHTAYLPSDAVVCLPPSTDVPPPTTPTIGGARD